MTTSRPDYLTPGCYLLELAFNREVDPQILYPVLNQLGFDPIMVDAVELSPSTGALPPKTISTSKGGSAATSRIRSALKPQTYTSAYRQAQADLSHLPPSGPVSSKVSSPGKLALTPAAIRPTALATISAASKIHGASQVPKMTFKPMGGPDTGPAPGQAPSTGPAPSDQAPPAASTTPDAGPAASPSTSDAAAQQTPQATPSDGGGGGGGGGPSPSTDQGDQGAPPPDQAPPPDVTQAPDGTAAAQAGPTDDQLAAAAAAQATAQTTDTTAPYGGDMPAADQLAAFIASLDSMQPGTPPAIPVPGETDAIKAARLRNLWRRWTEWGSPFAVSPGGPADQDTLSKVQIAGEEPVARFRILARLNRPLVLQDPPFATWLLARRLSIDPFADMHFKVIAFPLGTGRTYESVLVARDKQTPHKEDVKRMLGAMGFQPMKIALVRRNVRAPGRPSTSLSVWFALARWLGPDSYSVAEDPFYFEQMQEVVPG